MIRRSELPLLCTGFLATFSGVGLARFAYTALMPPMVLANWFSAEQVAYLGAANLLGYLLGALAAAPLAARWGAVPIMAVCWWVVALSFLGCSTPFSLPLFFLWRLLSGVAGAALMVLGPSVAMTATALPRRAVLGPLMFCGIGVGALWSATAIPVLAAHSLMAVWLGLAAIAAVTAVWGTRCAYRLPPPPPLAATVPTASTAPLRPLWTASVILVMAAYGMDGFGFVPHTVFWVDYLARELHTGAGYASTQWAIFGLGATLGPLGAAACANRWGWWRSTLGAYLLKTLAIGLPLLGAGFGMHALSGFMVGALSPGLAAITSGYLLQLCGASQHKKLWGYATAVFALLQALSGYCMAYLYVFSGSYRGLFAIGCGVLAVGAVLVVFSRSLAPHSRP